MPAVTSGLRDAEAAIVGRRDELERVERLIESEGRLLLVGDAGIGKTTLWRHGVESARGRGGTVLSAAPAEAEQAFSYAVLGDLFDPIADQVLGSLPPPQQRALEAALLRIEGAQADARTVGVAIGGALRSLGAPVVVAVDDVQWVDAASAAALEFALRRLESVTCLLAQRRGTTRRLQLDVEALEIGPLSVGGIHHLLKERLGVALPRPALLRLHELAGGNPFYALELARAYRATGEVGVPASLEAVTTDRLRRLSADTRRGLAELALAGTPPPGSRLEEALEAGVVGLEGDGVRFAHPLLAEASVSLLDPDERRALHRELADRAIDEGLRVRHLAKAAEGPDAPVAAAIAAAAERDRSVVASAELWELAAKMTPPADSTAVAERWTEAGIARVFSGNAAGIDVLREHVAQLPRGTLRARSLGLIALMHGATDMRLLAEGVESALLETDEIAARLWHVNTLCATYPFLGDVVRAARIADSYVEEAETTGDDALLARALANAAVFRLACAMPARDLIDRARSLDPSAVENAELFANLREGRLDEARAWIEAALADPEVHVIYRYHGLVANLAGLETVAGRWAEAQALADEALALGEQIEAPHMISGALAASATVDALLGHDQWARVRAVRAVELGAGIHATGAENSARYTLGLVELGLGRTAEAADVYRQITADGWLRWFNWPSGHPAFDAVEAFTAVGDLGTAREIAQLADRADGGSALEACLAAGEGDYDGAIALLNARESHFAPFRRARELLLLGRILRQARRRSEAREALTEAREDFRRLGSPPWVDRAEEELSRLGGRSPAGSTLTVSERRVAELVSAGLSNKEVATRLVVTVRTVEAHLSKIYAKLGVRSRTALAAAWKEQDPE